MRASDANKDGLNINTLEGDIVKVGTTVVIKIDNDFCQYTILDSGVTDINKKEISSESPIGKGLIGHSKNEIVEIAIPEGRKIKCEILEIKN